MPKWNPKKNGLTMSFGPRCKKASVQNFQLSANEHSPDDVILSHGKMTTGDFALDFKEPLGCVQAFALALITTRWK
jgi:hypothetical protein